NRTRPLTPLHSLADFCYAVRREVIDAIGPADEGYGLGPCWEMDYNVRADRAGFRGVWACGVYVYRAVFTGRRQRDEAAHFKANTRRYQDKFSGQRLRGLKTDYRPHCRGDDCPHFAPPNLIALGRPRAQPADRIVIPDPILTFPTRTTSSPPPAAVAWGSDRGMGRSANEVSRVGGEARENQPPTPRVAAPRAALPPPPHGAR